MAFLLGASCSSQSSCAATITGASLSMVALCCKVVFSDWLWPCAKEVRVDGCLASILSAKSCFALILVYDLTHTGKQIVPLVHPEKITLEKGPVRPLSKSRRQEFVPDFPKRQSLWRFVSFINSHESIV
jgi:hypothetical protein